MPAPVLLDHLTIASATPLELIAAASGAGFDGVGVFLRGMPEVAGMADFDLVHDRAARIACREAAADAGCTIAVAYPFTVSRWSVAEDFLRSLDAAAEIGAGAVNLLVFDRDVARRAETVAKIAVQVQARGLLAGVEFFPVSAVANLDDAIALCDAVPGLKITVDLLHLRRAGDSVERLRALRHRILVAQICDAPQAAPADLFAEASYDRLLPGDGELDPQALLEAIGPHVPISVEAPCASAGGLSYAGLAQRARQAVEQTLDKRLQTQS